MKASIESMTKKLKMLGERIEMQNDFALVTMNSSEKYSIYMIDAEGELNKNLQNKLFDDVEIRKHFIVIKHMAAYEIYCRASINDVCPKCTMIVQINSQLKDAPVLVLGTIGGIITINKDGEVHTISNIMDSYIIMSTNLIEYEDKIFVKVTMLGIDGTEVKLIVASFNPDGYRFVNLVDKVGLDKCIVSTRKPGTNPDDLKINKEIKIYKNINNINKKINFDPKQY